MDISQERCRLLKGIGTISSNIIGKVLLGVTGDHVNVGAGIPSPGAWIADAGGEYPPLRWIGWVYLILKEHQRRKNGYIVFTSRRPWFSMSQILQVRELRFVCFSQNLFTMFIEPGRESPDVARGARESHGNSDGSHLAFRRMFFALKKSERLQVFVIQEVFGG